MMRPLKTTFPFLLLCLFFAGTLPAQTGTVAARKVTARPVFVIVHGAWGGSWAFKKVDSLLTERGCTVYRPSLTGQGERYHLATRQVGLQTHINDVVNTILFEDLHDVVLVGHSYGGMVVTGVADSLAGRIRRIIYLDAFVPEHGESLLGIRGGSGSQGLLRMEENGFLKPAWVQPNAPLPRDVPHPVKTLTDTLRLAGRARNLPATYILTVAKGTPAEKDDFADQAERARKKGWKLLQLEADHNPQWSTPLALADLLYQQRN